MGGGLMGVGGTVRVENCEIAHNTGELGRGIYVVGTELIVTGTCITNNTVTGECSVHASVPRLLLTRARVPNAH
jgi:hypothetical protein